METTAGINIYSSGLCYCSVCADKDIPVSEIEDYLNTENPTGIESKWKLAGEPFADGVANPGNCDRDVTKQHLLFSC